MQLHVIYVFANADLFAYVMQVLLHMLQLLLQSHCIEYHQPRKTDVLKIRINVTDRFTFVLI